MDSGQGQPPGNPPPGKDQGADTYNPAKCCVGITTGTNTGTRGDPTAANYEARKDALQAVPSMINM